MTPPIRPLIAKLAQLPEGFETMPLRALVDWYKEFVLEENALPLTELEDNLVSESWMAWVKVLSTRENVPVGWLSYSINQLVDAEINLIKVAAREANEQS